MNVNLKFIDFHNSFRVPCFFFMDKTPKDGVKIVGFGLIFSLICQVQPQAAYEQYRLLQCYKQFCFAETT